MVKLATVTLPESFFSLIFLKYSLHLENALRWRSITEGCFWLLPHQTTNLASLNYMQKLLKTFKRCPGLFLSILHTLNSRSNAQKMKFSIKDFFNKCDQMCIFPNTENNGISERSYLGEYFKISNLEYRFPNLQHQKPTRHRVKRLPRFSKKFTKMFCKNFKWNLQ